MLALTFPENHTPHHKKVCVKFDPKTKTPSTQKKNGNEKTPNF